MIWRALDAGAAAAWVAADKVYGHDSQLRRFLEGRQMAYVLVVASEQRLWQSDFMQHRVDAIALNLPASQWKRLSAGLGSKGERWKRWSAWLANAGRSNKPSRPQKANVDWITTKCVTGKAGIDISRWSCWPTLCYPCCEHTEEKTPDAQVRLSVPKLRHLLTALLWRGWHGLEQLRHRSQ